MGAHVGWEPYRIDRLVDIFLKSSFCWAVRVTGVQTLIQTPLHLTLEQAIISDPTPS